VLGLSLLGGVVSAAHAGAVAASRNTPSQRGLSNHPGNRRFLNGLDRELAFIGFGVAVST